MAATVTKKTLKLQFNVTPTETSTSTKKTWSFNYIATEPETQDIQALINIMITNKEVFENQPVSILEASIEETTSEKIIPAE